MNPLIAALLLLVFAAPRAAFAAAEDVDAKALKESLSELERYVEPLEKGELPQGFGQSYERFTGVLARLKAKARTPQDEEKLAALDDSMNDLVGRMGAPRGYDEGGAHLRRILDDGAALMAPAAVAEREKQLVALGVGRWARNVAPLGQGVKGMPVTKVKDIVITPDGRVERSATRPAVQVQEPVEQPAPVAEVRPARRPEDLGEDLAGVLRQAGMRKYGQGAVGAEEMPAAVKAFQKLNGLPRTGKVDEETSAILDGFMELRNKALAGDRPVRGEPKSERVEALQKKLRAAGLGRVAEDGMYGDQTHAAFCRALLRSRDCDIADGDWEKIDLALDAPPRRRRRRS